MANKSYVNPYVDLIQYFNDGLDYIVANYSGPGTEEDLAVVIYNYMNSTFSVVGITNESQMLMKSIIANAMNGYINYGEGINPELKSEPVMFLSSYFEQLENSINTASSVKSPQTNNQITLALGKASYDYWLYVYGNPSEPWNAYNVVSDINNIPYWVSAAMFGARYNFNQVMIHHCLPLL